MVELTEKGLSFFSLFEKVTHTMPSDYVEGESFLVFIVDPQSLGMAIGKKGANIKRLSNAFRKKVVIVGNSDDPEEFIRNFFKNVNILGIEERDVMGEKAMIVMLDEKDRGIAIGRNGERIKALKSFMKDKFNATVHIKTRRVLEQY